MRMRTTVLLNAVTVSKTVAHINSTMFIARKCGSGQLGQYSDS